MKSKPLVLNPRPRWLRRYKLMVHGFDFSVELKKEHPPAIGFYTTHWVDAFDPEQATQKTFEKVRQRLAHCGYQSVLDQVRLEIDEIDEAGFWSTRWKEKTGFTFYHSYEE